METYGWRQNDEQLSVHYIPLPDSLASCYSKSDFHKKQLSKALILHCHKLRLFNSADRGASLDYVQISWWLLAKEPGALCNIRSIKPKFAVLAPPRQAPKGACIISSNHAMRLPFL